ncbi:MAG: M36 family metallopeptidase [Limisphaera sp.]|nr:M36 family metallopeptidase [Limisphaera sp.]
MNRPVSTRWVAVVHAVTGVVLAILLGSALEAWALLPRPQGAALPDMDLRGTPGISVLERAKREAALVRIQQVLPGVRVDCDPVVGSARFVRRTTGFLTGPVATWAGTSIAAVPAVTPEAVVRAFLDAHRDLFGHGGEVLDSARIVRDTVSPHSGLRTVVWQQELGGLPLFEADLVANLTAQGELVSVASRMVAEPISAAERGTPGWPALMERAPVDPRQALERTLQHLGQSSARHELRVLTTVEPHGYRRFLLGGRSGWMRQVWLPLDGTRLRLAWEVHMPRERAPEQYQVVLDAETGEIILRRQTSFFISNASYRVYTSDSPSPFTPGWPTPNAAQPPYTNRVLVTWPALDVTASPNGWINDGDNETRGNNADCFLDRDFDFQPDGPRPQGNPTRVFDFPLDLAQEPLTYTNASIVQMFYWVNWFHDRAYQLGFSESAGNYQQDNFGRGGLGNDPILGYVQSGADVGLFNNAFFIPSPDGTPGQIAMFLWNGPTPDRDGDLDAEVVIHEATHGLTTRLVGGGNGMTASQSRGLGEGWSDFYPLALLSQPGDDLEGVYPIAGYAAFQLAGLRENYYFGIRRYPYTTDMSKNPLTFKDIDPNQISPYPGVPRSPIWPYDPQEADEYHNQGEVWCAILWEVRANLIRKHGFEGNELMLRLVTDGLKLCPPNPNFVEARDAIILADLVATAGANARELWTGFAKRGLGFSARSPDSRTTVGVVEAYDTPGLTVVGALVAGGNGNGMVDDNECNDLYLMVANFNNFTATGVRVRVSTLTPGVGLGVRESDYRDLPPLALGTNRVPFQLSTAPYLVCGTPITLQVVIESDQETVTNTWTLNTGLMGGVRRFDNNQRVVIPDNTPAGASSGIAVSNVISALRKVAVSVYITHTWVGDLRLELVAPDGTTVVLSESNGGSGDNYGVACSPETRRTTFDDDGALPIGSGIPPYLGTFRPQQPLASLVGKSGAAINGIWRLRVVDEAQSDTGAIECWSLYLWPAECTDGGGSCPGADVAVSLSVAPDPVFLGSNLTYTITVTNRGPSAGRSTVVRHELPTDVMYISSQPSRGSVASFGNTVVWNLGDLPYQAGAQVRVIALPTKAGTLRSRAVVTSLDPDGDLSNNEAIVISRVMPQASDLVLEATAVPETGLRGQLLQYRLRVRNLGPSPASGVFVTNELSASFVLQGVRVSQGAWTTMSSFLVWSVGAMLAGSEAQMVLEGLPVSEGTLLWRAQAGALQADPFPENNLVELRTVVGPAANVSLIALASPNPAIVNVPYRYLLSVTNAGPSLASGVILNGTLSAGQRVVSNYTSRGTITVQNNEIRAALGSLLPGETAVVILTASSATTGNFTLNAQVSLNEVDPVPTDNRASATVSVAAPFVSIRESGATLVAESLAPANGALDDDETVTLELRLRNAGNVNNLNLVATLLPGNGVENPSGPQTYGVLPAGGLPVGRPFTFTARRTPSGTVTAVLQLTDNGQPLPAVQFTFALPRTISFSNTAAIQIPDSRLASPYPSTIQVSGVEGTVGRVTVTLSNLTHSYAADIQALLVGPRGQKSLLMAGAGAPYGVANATLTFDDGALDLLPAADPLQTGRYRPAAHGEVANFPAPAPAGPYGSPLSVFAGQEPNGPWSLYVRDVAAGDSGQILGGWNLTFYLVTPINQMADLEVTGTARPATLAGQQTIVELVVINRGPNPAHGVVLSTRWPIGLVPVAAQTSMGEAWVDGQTVGASVSRIDPGSSVTVRVTADARAAGTHSVIAEVRGAEVDLNGGNNQAVVLVPVNLPRADLRVSVESADLQTVLGRLLELRLQLTNAGPETALNPSIRLNLPAGLEYVSGSATGGTIETSSGAVMIQYNRLISAVAVEAVVVVRASRVGTGQLEAVASSDSVELVPSDNVARLNLNVVPPQPRIVLAGLRVTSESRAPANGSLDPGEEVSLAVGLRNVGELPTQALVARLREGDWASGVGPAQHYGVLTPGGPTVWRTFTFTVRAAPGSAVQAVWELQDGVTELPALSRVLQVAQTRVLRNTNAIVIPERGVASPYPSIIPVSDAMGVVTGVRVVLHGLGHGYPDDVDVLLVGPDGQRVMLMSDAGGAFAVTNLTLRLDDAAGVWMPDNARLTNGIYRPTDYEPHDTVPPPAPRRPYAGTLGSLVGSLPNGDWALYVVDDVAGERGGIARGWELELTTGELISPLAALRVHGTVSATTVSAGGEVTYTLEVTNDGPSPAEEVLLNVSLPAGAEVRQVTASRGSVVEKPSGIEVVIGGLPSGETAQVRWTLRLWQAGPAIVAAIAEASTTDLELSDNSVQFAAEVTAVSPARLVGEYDQITKLFRITLTGQPGEIYKLQSSEDLRNWTDMETQTVPASGELKFTDSQSINHLQRFYRAVRVLP